MTDKQEYTHYKIIESDAKIKCLVCDSIFGSDYHIVFDQNKIAELLMHDETNIFNYDLYLEDMLSALKFIRLKLSLSRHVYNYEDLIDDVRINDGPTIEFVEDEYHTSMYVVPQVEINTRHSVSKAKYQRILLTSTPLKNVIDALYSVAYDKDSIFKIISDSNAYAAGYVKTKKYYALLELIDKNVMVKITGNMYNIINTNWHVYFDLKNVNTKSVVFRKGSDRRTYSYRDLVYKYDRPIQKQKANQFGYILETFKFLKE